MNHYSRSGMRILKWLIRSQPGQRARFYEKEQVLNREILSQQSFVPAAADGGRFCFQNIVLFGTLNRSAQLGVYERHNLCRLYTYTKGTIVLFVYVYRRHISCLSYTYTNGTLESFRTNEAVRTKMSDRTFQPSRAEIPLLDGKSYKE